MKNKRVRQSSFNPPKTFLSRLKKKHNFDQIPDTSRIKLAEEIHVDNHLSSKGLMFLDHKPVLFEPKIMDPLRKNLLGVKALNLNCPPIVLNHKIKNEHCCTLKIRRERTKPKNQKKGPITKFLFGILDSKFSKSKVQYRNTILLDLYHSQLAVIAMLEFLISLVSIVVTIFLQSGIDEDEGIDSYNYRLRQLALSFLTTLTITLWIIMIMEYWIDSKVISTLKQIPSFCYRRSRLNILYLVLKMTLFGVHPNPAFSEVKVSYYSSPYNAYVEYPVNSILSIFIIFRIVFTIKFFIALSGFSKPRTSRIAKMKGVSLDFIYYFKVLTIKNSFFIYPMLFVMFMLFGSFGLIVGETPFESLTGNDFHTWWNAMWCTIITIMTIGYGDYVPRSIIGRIIVIISGVGGAFLLSMLIATFNNIFSFDKGEKQVCLLIERLILEEKIKVQTSEIIPKYAKLVSALRKNANPKIEDYQNLKRKLYRCSLDLKGTISSIKQSFHEERKNDFIFDQTGQMQIRLDILKKKFDQLSERFMLLEIRNSEIEETLKDDQFLHEDCSKLNLKSFACDSIKQESFLNASLAN